MDKKHVTGLLYFDSSKPSLAEDLGIVSTPLLDVAASELRPSEEMLNQMNSEFLGQ
jgi:hypothetical protein